MKRSSASALVALIAAPVAGAVLTASPAAAAVPVQARPAAVLRCHAWMSNTRPRDYTRDYVNVDTVRYAGVTTVAHYRTVNTTHTARANASGYARIGYYISGATPGYRVNVSVTVTSGRTRGYCSTSFTPYR